MKSVVDASVALKWYFPENGAAEATRLLDQAIEGATDLLAPDLIWPEFANALWRKIRQSECTAEQALAILELFEQDAPALVASGPLAARAVELAHRLGETVYDCLYLAAAIEEGASLATADARLARCARSVVADVELIA
jgi:predicted nucleic acid-binding protein